jgi:hypothetical protein
VPPRHGEEVSIYEAGVLQRFAQDFLESSQAAWPDTQG